jgi:N-sulfoglucosamine sulfohydrolase
VGCALLLGTWERAKPGAGLSPSSPNILYLHSHDTGRYIEPYGYAIRTPRIQRFAEEGFLFRQAFCVASTCSGSRAALVTGEYAHSNGMMGLAHRGWSLNDYGHHIHHVLRPLGYRSILVGEQHIANDVNRIGYDEVAHLDSTRVDDVVPVAVEILRDRPAEPFYLSVGFFETHRRFFSPPPRAENYVRPPTNLPDLPATRRDMAAFAASAASLDRGVGAVLDALDQAGFADNTLVILTTDHGAPFPGAKTTMTDRGVGVFLILRGPDGFRGGQATDALVSHIDVFPTICEVVAAQVPDWAQGVSLLPLADGSVDRVRDAVFAEGTYHAAYEPQRMVRTERWKYVRRFEPRTEPVLPNIDESPSKDVWLELGWPSWLLDEHQFYDLALDPNESRNLASDPGYGKVLGELQARLEHWMRETNDPLLQGPVAPPPGTTFNDPDQRSADEPVTGIFLK